MLMGMTPEQYAKASFLERTWDYLESLYAYSGVQKPPAYGPPGAPETTPELTVAGEWTPEKAIASGHEESIRQWQEFYAAQAARNEAWSTANWVLIGLLGLGAAGLLWALKR